MSEEPQIMIKCASGDHGLFNVDDYSAYERVVADLRRGKEVWVAIGDDALMKREDIQRVFYFDKGYGHVIKQQQCASSDGVPQCG